MCKTMFISVHMEVSSDVHLPEGSEMKTLVEEMVERAELSDEYQILIDGVQINGYMED